MNQRSLKLSYQDSNLDRQNQKLQCYHYTIRQSLLPKTYRPKALQRYAHFFYCANFFATFLFCNEQEVVFLAFLYEYILAIEEHIG